MSKIKDLVTFSKIKDVIDIDALGDKKKLVENYLISPAMEDYLVHLLIDINKDTHKAAQVVGGYGSGKSHLLAFIISILSDPKLRSSIQNKRVREEAEKIDRDFIVIHWELQPNDVELSEYFYDQVETQLEKNYNISFEFKTDGVPDHKKNIRDVLEIIKRKDPKRGLVVIFDEISDFLKQKAREKIRRDTGFLRILGQVAQESDFMFIGAMQEHIFTNPKYVDEAESFGRVSERFQIITIKREDIKRVISQRVLHKSKKQKIELESALSSYVKYYPMVQSNIDDYIDLFPIHPYVIQTFSELPYFEKRGVIQFTMQEVEEILNEDFPSIITFDKIFDEIASKHTVKHLDNVAPIVEAVTTLDTKIDLLEDRDKDNARKLIKALAILKLLGKSTKNGATAQELANELLYLPQNKKIDAKDEIVLVLDRLRKVTDGRFISKTDDGYYFLDLESGPDYDQVILRKTDNLPEDAMDNEILDILKDQLSLTANGVTGIFNDSCGWKSKRSFRDGQFIYETGKGEVATRNGDYQIVFVSPFCAKNRYNASPSCIIIEGSLSSEATEELKKVAAANELLKENIQRSIIQKKYVGLKKQFTEMFVQSYLDNGTINKGSEKKSIKLMISREFSNFDELFFDIKPEFFDEYFTTTYPKHPKFSQTISRDNILGEFSKALKDLMNRSGAQGTISTTTTLINAMDLLDDKKNLSTSKSEIAVQILKVAKENAGKNVAIKEILDRYKASPFGYDPIMTEFIIAVLTFNGEIALKAKGGKTISSSDVDDVFKSGLEAFENILYLTLESDFDIQPVITLFTTLGVDSDAIKKMRVSAKRNEAIQEFRTKYLQIKEQVSVIDTKLGTMSLSAFGILNIDTLKTKQEKLKADLPLDDFEKVKTPNDLKRIVYDPERITTIGNSLTLLYQMYTFYNLYTSDIEREVNYILEVQKVLEECPDILSLDGAQDEISSALSLLKDSDKILLSENQNLVRGKLQQVQRKYKAAYYKAHDRYVGDKVDWSRLTGIRDSPEYQQLRILKNIVLLDRLRFSKVEDEITVLSRMHCPDFRAEILDTKVLCPRCDFPKGWKESDIDKRITVAESEISAIYSEWERTVLSELNNYRDNVKLLNSDEQKLINGVIKSGKLPSPVSEPLVIAFNNLFKELELIEISEKMLADALFSDSQVMDYLTFDNRLKTFKDSLVKGKDLDKVRIKMAQKEEK